MRVVLTEEFISNNLRTTEGSNRCEFVDVYKGGIGMYCEVRATSPGQGTYYLRWKQDGKTRHKKLGRTTEIDLDEARQRAKTLKAEITLGKVSSTNDKDIPTLGEFFEDHYLPQAKVHNRGWKKKAQMWDLKLKATFGHKRLDQIKRHDVITWHTGLHAGGLSPAYADRFLALLRHVLNKAVEYELLDKNPASGVKMFNPDNTRTYRLNEEELKRLVDTLNNHKNRNVCLIALFALSTGMRIGEVLKAQWDDVDRQGKLLRIHASVAKTKKGRSIPLNDSAMSVLDQLDTEGKFDALFINRRTGKPYTTISRQWVLIRNAAGLPRLRIHDLRHQFASLLVNEGVSLYIVKSLLGHSQITTTEKYSHLASDSLLEASSQVANILNDVAKKTA